MSNPRPYRLIFSGGGTGGHIFPAIAIATHCRARHPDAQILFVGAKGKMEMIKAPEAGFEIVGLWIGGLQRRITLSNLFFPIKLLFSLLRARRILSQFRPDVVISTGGYAGGPIGLAAGWAGIPVLIQEQNSYAGLANRWMAHTARVICVAYSGMERYFPAEKIVFTGNPVQQQLLEPLAEKRQEALSYFALSPSKPVLLILGGSLGARTINESVLAGLDKLMEAGVQALWQTGKAYHEPIRQRLAARADSVICCREFIQRMDLAYAASDVVISRAGALTLSELCVAARAAILVPSPNVAEDHQTQNARALERRDAAIVVRDDEARQTLIDLALDLLKDEARCERLADGIGRLATPNATRNIVAQVEKLIGCA